MGKHRIQNTRTVRRVAAASALAVGATTLAASPANAVEIPAPVAGSSANMDVDSLYKQGIAAAQNIPGVEEIPGVTEFLAQQDGAADYGQAATQAVTQVAHAEPAAAPASNGQAIVDAARAKIGSPYGWGATGPNAFDCSGLTSWAYQQAGKSIPRTSQAQAAQGTPVSQHDMQPGDIIAYYGGASHVAIYAGNGMMIDALNSGSTVQERPVNYMPIHSVVRF